VLKEMAEGTFRPRNRELVNQSFGKKVKREYVNIDIQ